MRTLVVHTGGIGDFILACPAISRLEGDVELLGRPERLALAVEGGIANAAHDIETVEFHTLLSRPSDRFKRFVSRFDRVVVWMRDEDGQLEKGLTACGLRRIEIFPGLPGAEWNLHASEYYNRCLGLETLENFRLNVSASPNPPDIVIHPGSGSPKKNWPLDRFRALASKLERDGRQVEWCLGPAELERGGAFLELAPRLNAASLIELARNLAGARLYVGNDSGVTHLAGVLGCPAVALFGASDAEVWRPMGSRTRVVGGSAWPSLSDVLQAIAAIGE